MCLPLFSVHAGDQLMTCPRQNCFRLLLLCECKFVNIFEEQGLEIFFLSMVSPVAVFREPQKSRTEGEILTFSMS